jgi:1-acyl-sn-glycerol-3-phosphate acyltransferase
VTAALPAHRPPPPRLFRAAVAALRPAMLAITRRDWHGSEHLPEGPCIVAANHLSMFDPLCVGHYLVDHGLYPRAMAKASLFRAPVVGRLMRGAGAIPVERGSSTCDALGAAAAALTEGWAVLVFPEGTTTQDPDVWPMRAKTGAARLALRTGVPVVPLAQWGAQQVVPTFGYGFRPFPPARSSVLAGPAVDLDDLRDDPEDPAAWTEATERIMRRITEQLAVIRGERPPAQPWVGRPVR